MNSLCYIVWRLDPDLIHFGSLTIRWYGFLYVFALYMGYQLMASIYKTEKFPAKEVEKITVYTILGTILGARIWRVFILDRDWYFNHPGEIIRFWEGGLSAEGAVLGILLALYFYTRKSTYIKSYLWLMDRIVLAVGIGSFIIRIGNMMNSEIYGNPTDLPWGVKFIHAPRNLGVPLENVHPRHPTQVYEAILYLFVYLLLKRYYNHKRKSMKPGTIFGLFLVSVFTIRFFVDFLNETRTPFEKNFLEKFGLTFDQYFSILFVVVGVIVLLISGKMKAKKIKL